MRWFRKNKDASNGESRKALEDAKENLKDVKSRNEEVKEVVKSFRVMKERDHFAEQLEIIIGGRY